MRCAIRVAGQAEGGRRHVADSGLTADHLRLDMDVRIVPIHVLASYVLPAVRVVWKARHAVG